MRKISHTTKSPMHHFTKSKCDPNLKNESYWYFLWNLDFYTLVRSIHFSFKWYQNYANLPTGSNFFDKSIWLPYRVPFWETGLRKFVLHTTVFQQLQFKMPETVIKHHTWNCHKTSIWPLKVMFSNRKMPEASDFDENRKSIFLTCRSKIVAFCIVTMYQCDSFRAVGSQISILHFHAMSSSHPTCLSTYLPWPAHRPSPYLF